LTPFHPLIDLPFGTTLVEASAGTGKTYNLTNLCLRLVVERGVPVDRILLVTFTRAATAELRDRLRARFVEAAEALRAAAEGAQPEDPVQRHLAWDGDGPRADLEQRGQLLDRAVRDVDAAAVFTIHGFCQRVLSEHALATGHDPTADLLEDTRAALDEVVLDEHVALRHAMTPHELGFIDAAKLGLTHLREIAWSVTHHADARIEPDGPFPAFRDLHARLARAWEREGAAAVAWVHARIADGTLNRQSYNPARVDAKAEALASWLAGGPAAPETLTLFGPTNLRARVKKGMALPADLPGVLTEVEALGAALPALADAASGAVARALRARYERALDRDGAISFDRLIRDVAAKVDDPGLQRALRDRYHAALIDEFQDTDGAQWRIFHALFGTAPDRRLILVGDPKQAIYAFRGADVRVYGAARDATPAARRFTMTTNHRSDGPLVEAINALFHPTGRDAALDAFGEPYIRYEPVDVPERHRAPRVALPERAPVALRWFDAATFGGEPGAAVKSTVARDAMPTLVVGEVRALLRAGGTIDRDGEQRSVRPGDLAVLTLTNLDATRIRDALARSGLPAAIQQGAPVTGSEAATWLSDWLAAVATPTADAPLRRFAVGPLGGWTLPDLHAALHAADDPDAQARWVALCDRVSAQASLFHRRGFVAAYNALLSSPDDDPLDRIARTPRGERALTDLSHLAELLHAASATRRGPAALGAWLAAQRVRPDEDAESLAQRLETDARAIKIVTIHKSKGLQYPIVLLPDLWRPLSDRRLPKRITPFELSPGETRLDVAVDDKAEPKRSRVQAHAAAQLRERVRLLYVAMTRAEHHLIIWGGTHDKFGLSPLAALLAAHDPGSEDPVADARDLGGGLAEARDLLQAPLESGLVSLDPCEPAVHGFSPEPAEAPVLATSAAYGRGPFDRAWRRLSFTALTAAAHGPAAAPSAEADYDEVDAGASPEPTDPGAPADEVPLARFPRGREAGVYVHGVLEKLDFRTCAPRDGATTLADLLRDDARRIGLGDEAALDDLAAALPTILASPLRGPLGSTALRDLPLADRLDELAFDLPVRGGFGWRAARGGVTGAALAEALVDAAPEVPGFRAWLGRLAALQPDAVAGFLTGSVDLVARVHTPDGPRYFLADYKTNRLSTPTPADPAGRSTPADYAPERLAAAMAEHHYFLQASLYLVALDRYLRQRAGADYDYDRDVLGAAYLFVRGMSGAPGAGVLTFRPPAATIVALSAALDGAAP
jgi:exodeoxyribonuclease V beta subunit